MARSSATADAALVKWNRGADSCVALLCFRRGQMAPSDRVYVLPRAALDDRAQSTLRDWPQHPAYPNAGAAFSHIGHIVLYFKTRGDAVRLDELNNYNLCAHAGSLLVSVTVGT